MKPNMSNALPTATVPNAHIYSVSELNQLARRTLELKIGQAWICGEISNLSQPHSGHGYFSLKDSHAQVRCAMFRFSLQKLKFKLENGQHVIALADVSLYEPRGDFQLIVSHLELTGDGALQLAFEQLKKRLAAEGLFDVQFKKKLPIFPKTIGIITSATGAAIRDILTVLKRRFAVSPIIIYPTLVQGKQAAEHIVRAIQLANQRQECDVLMLARGGGSLEDLWPFNEEIVARAIFASKIPMVTGIGHEIDFTIADFVADLRAPTPSAAAEHVSPNVSDLQQQLVQMQQRLNKLINDLLQRQLLTLTHLQQRLCHPGQRLKQQMQQLDQLEQRLILAQRHVIKHEVLHLNQLILKFNHVNPMVTVSERQTNLTAILNQLNVLMTQSLQQYRQQLQYLAHGLQLVSPLTTLERGFAIVSKAETGEIIRSSQQTHPGDRLNLKLAEGALTCEVI